MKDTVSNQEKDDKKRRMIKMGIDDIVKKIESKEKSIKDKVHSMEKEVIGVYEQYRKVYSGYLKYEPDEYHKYAIETFPSGELMMYKIKYEISDSPKRSDRGTMVYDGKTYKSGESVISKGHQSYTKCDAMDPTYVSALRTLKDYMTSKLEEKSKKLDDLDKKLFG